MKHFMKYLLYVNIHVMGVFNTHYSVAYLFQHITRDVMVCCFGDIVFLCLFIITYYYFCIFQILGDVRQCILATDLALFFGNRARLQEVSDKKEFSWDNYEHRYVSTKHKKYSKSRFVSI